MADPRGLIPLESLGPVAELKPVGGVGIFIGGVPVEAELHSEVIVNGDVVELL